MPSQLYVTDEHKLETIGGSFLPGALLEKLKTVDGPGSGLNADFLDGLSLADFPRSMNGISDFNAVNESRPVLFATTSAPVNGPPVSANYMVGVQICLNEDPSFRQQIAWLRGYAEIFKRQMDGGTWGAWHSVPRAIDKQRVVDTGVTVSGYVKLGSMTLNTVSGSISSIAFNWYGGQVSDFASISFGNAHIFLRNITGSTNILTAVQYHFPVTSNANRCRFGYSSANAAYAPGNEVSLYLVGSSLGYTNLYYRFMQAESIVESPVVESAAPPNFVYLTEISV